MHRSGIFAAFFAGLLAVAGVALSPLPAMAATESGSHAWSTSTLVLRQGPGTVYHVTGEIAPDLAIKVVRCQQYWCVVDGTGGRGWTRIEHIDFGRGPTIKVQKPGQAEVCFYEHENYKGAAFCATGSRVVNDLLLLGLDNRFSSVSVSGNVSVAICRDRKFQSYCERVFFSQPVLDQYLNNNVSSFRLHYGN